MNDIPSSMCVCHIDISVMTPLRLVELLSCISNEVKNSGSFCLHQFWAHRAESSRKFFWLPVVCHPSIHLFILLSVHMSVCKLFTFSSSSQEPIGQFNQTWHKAFVGKGDSSLFKCRATPFSRGRYYKIAKIHWQNLKIFFSRTTGAIWTKLSTKHPWIKVTHGFKNKNHIIIKNKIIGFNNML